MGAQGSLAGQVEPPGGSDRPTPGGRQGAGCRSDWEEGDCRRERAERGGLLVPRDSWLSRTPLCVPLVIFGLTLLILLRGEETGSGSCACSNVGAGTNKQCRVACAKSCVYYGSEKQSPPIKSIMWVASV